MDRKEDCRDCKYYEENIDMPWPVCNLHHVHFEDDYAPCENFESRSGSTGSGCGLLFWIIIIIAVFMFCTRSCGNSAQPVPPHNPQQSEPPAEETPEDDPSGQDSGFIFPHSDTQLIAQQEAEALSDSDLTYAINEIYARHGYIFRSSELSEYYGQFSWYKAEVPSSEFSVDCFNQTEQQNWKLLVNERNSRKASD